MFSIHAPFRVGACSLSFSALWLVASCGSLYYSSAANRSFLFYDIFIIFNYMCGGYVLHAHMGMCLWKAKGMGFLWGHRQL